MKKNEHALRPSAVLGVSWFALGALFFFNPLFNLVDLLPDFLGALCMITALRRLRDVTPYLETARRGFLRFFWFNLSRIPAFLIMFRIFHNHTAEQSVMLVFTFTYAFLEIVLLAVVFLNLFDGFLYLGERYDGQAAFRIVRTKKTDHGYVFAPEKEKSSAAAKSDRGSKNRDRFDLSRLKWFSVVAMALLRFLSVLPQLVYLSGQSGDTATTIHQIPQTEFKGIYTVLAFLPALAVGIAWLVLFRRYIHGLCADDCFCGGILAYLDENYPPEHLLFSYRRFCRVSIFLLTAVFFAVDFFLDEQNILPDVLAAAVLLFAVFYIDRKLFPLPGWVKTLSGLGFAGSAASFGLFLSFHRAFSFSDVWRREEATLHYFSYHAVEGLSAILFTVVICFLFLRTTRYVRSELGEKNLLSYQTRVLTEIGGHRRRVIWVCAFAVLSALSGVVYRLLLVDTESVALKTQSYTDTTHLYIPRVDFFWMIDLALALVFFAAVLWYFEKLKESLRYKYALED